MCTCTSEGWSWCTKIKKSENLGQYAPNHKFRMISEVSPHIWMKYESNQKIFEKNLGFLLVSPPLFLANPLQYYYSISTKIKGNFLGLWDVTWRANTENVNFEKFKKNTVHKPPTLISSQKKKIKHRVLNISDYLAATQWRRKCI